MADTDNDSRPRWGRGKLELKEQIESAIDAYLKQAGELTDRQKRLLADAIGNAHKGLYPLAMRDIDDLRLPENAWSPNSAIDPVTVEGVTREARQRALVVLRSEQVQEPPVFR